MEALLAHQAPTLFGAGREPQRAGTPQPAPRRRRPVPAPQRTPLRPLVQVQDGAVQLLPIGDLAKALGRSVGHVRLLEQQGVLPPAHARRRVRGHRGWRMYRADFVAAVAVIAREERIAQRRAVMDLSRLQQRVWAVDHALRATAGRSD